MGKSNKVGKKKKIAGYETQRGTAVAEYFGLRYENEQDQTCLQGKERVTHHNALEEMQAENNSYPHEVLDYEELVTDEHTAMDVAIEMGAANDVIVDTLSNNTFGDPPLRTGIMTDKQLDVLRRSRDQVVTFISSDVITEKINSLQNPKAKQQMRELQGMYLAQYASVREMEERLGLDQGRPLETLTPEEHAELIEAHGKLYAIGNKFHQDINTILGSESPGEAKTTNYGRGYSPGRQPSLKETYNSLPQFRIPQRLLDWIWGILSGRRGAA